MTKRGRQMQNNVVILIAEDDEGHAGLIRKNLARAGIVNEIIHFKDGQETLDFFFGAGDGPTRELGTPYVLLLDISMPKIDGIEVLKKLKAHPELRKMPVTMISTQDDPKEVERSHAIGCSNYVTKPLDYETFVNTIRQLGLFLAVVEVPTIEGEGTG